MRASVTVSDSIPQALHVPTVAQAVVVQIPDGPAARLDPPVLAVSAVGPPPALDPPAPDHVGHLVPAAPPDEGRGHPGVPFDPNLDLLVVPLGHRFSRSDRPPRNRTYVREGTMNVRPAGDASQALVPGLSRAGSGSGAGGLRATPPIAGRPRPQPNAPRPATGRLGTRAGSRCLPRLPSPPRTSPRPRPRPPPRRRSVRSARSSAPTGSRTARTGPVASLGARLAALVPLAMEGAPAGLVEVADEDPVHLDRLAAVVPEGHAPMRHAAVALDRDRLDVGPELGRNAPVHPRPNDRLTPARLLPERPVCVHGALGEQAGNLVGVVRGPCAEVPPQPALERVGVHRPHRRLLPR